MDLIVTPGQPLHGEITLPGDKSLSHRAAVLAALAEGESVIRNFLPAGVTYAMLDSLRCLGVELRLEGSTLWVKGQGLAGLHPSQAPLQCGNSATTLRLLAGLIAACGIPAVLDGSSGLRARPMSRIIQPLQAMGVPVAAQDSRAPLEFQARNGRLHSIDHQLPVASAQVKSCLLLAGLAADGPVILREPGPSRDHTERLYRSLGLHIAQTQESGAGGKTSYITRFEPPERLHLPPLNLRLPADISAAAFLIVAALITPGSHLRLRSVGLNPTRTGLLDALQRMGAEVRIEAQGEQGGEPVGDLDVRASSLFGIEISGDMVVRMIDEFPAFAVAAAFASGQTIVTEAEELRYKESDRIAAVCSQLRSLGAEVQETAGGFVLQGGALSGGQVSPSGDHRLAMSLAVAGLAAHAPVRVTQAEIYRESFPDFVDALQACGAVLRTEG